jgi:hypothetical protein
MTRLLLCYALKKFCEFEAGLPLVQTQMLHCAHNIPMIEYPGLCLKYTYLLSGLVKTKTP